MHQKLTHFVSLNYEQHHITQTCFLGKIRRIGEVISFGKYDMY